MKRLAILISALAALGLGHASKADAQPQQCYPMAYASYFSLTTTTYFDPDVTSPTEVHVFDTMACSNPVGQHFVNTISINTCGSVLGSVQGEVTQTNPDLCFDGGVYPDYGTGGCCPNPTLIWTYFTCKDNLLSHRQQINGYRITWYEHDSVLNTFSGPFTGTMPAYNGPNWSRRCGLI